MRTMGRYPTTSRGFPKARIVPAVLLVLAFSCCLAPASADAAKWTLRNPLTQVNSLHGIAYGEDKFVAVGEGGRVMTSPDGVTWTVGDSGVGTSLVDVVYGSGQFVAIGEHPSTHRTTILTSPDGIAWTLQAPVWGVPVGITYGGDQFVIVSEGYLIYTSPDGVTWTKVREQTPWLTGGVTYGGGQFVAVGLKGAVVTSPDGVAWTEQTTGIWPKVGLEGIAYGAGQFVAYSGGVVLTSPDGVTWTKYEPLELLVWFDELAWGGGQFVAAVTSYEGGLISGRISYRILTSPQGATWTTRSVGWSFNDMAYGAGQFVAVGDYGEIRTSPDGVTWTTQTPGACEELWDVIYAGQFVAVGRDGAILTSPDGLTWWSRESGTSLFHTVLTGVAHGNGQFVAVGSQPWIEDIAYSSVILTSSDGVTWTNRPPPPARFMILFDIAFGGGRFVAVGLKAEMLLLLQSEIIAVTSTDGAEWATRPLPTGSSAAFGTKITYAEDQFVAVGTKGTVLTSPDGLTWTLRASGTEKDLRGIAYGEGQLLAVGEDGTVLVSPDGVVWTVQGPDPAVSLTDLMDVVYGDGRFVAVGGDAIFSSSDGVTWSKWSSGTTRTLRSIAYGGDCFVAAGDRGIIFTARAGVVTLTLRVGATEFVVTRGDEETVLQLDAAPEIPAGTARTFLPIRPVVEALGGDIFWSAEDQRVEIRGKHSVVLWIGRGTAVVDGVEVPIDETNPAVQPYLAPPGRTMLPLRFIAEVLGAEVSWTNETQTIVVSYSTSVR